MMNLKKIITPLLCATLFFFALGCKRHISSDFVTIQVENGLNTRGKVVLKIVDTTHFMSFDSASLKSGNTVIFNVPSQTGNLYFLEYSGNRSNLFAAFPGDSIAASVTSTGVQLSGNGRETAETSFFWRKLNLAARQVDSITQQLMELRHLPGFMESRQQANAKVSAILGTLRNEALDFIEKNETFLGILPVMNARVGNQPLFEETVHPGIFLEVDTLLQLHHPGNPHTIFYHNRMNQLRERLNKEQQAQLRLAPGSKAPDIELPGVSGKNISLYSQKNKLTLLYFWSPADAISRKSNQQIKLLHEKYKDRGFGIFAVSLESFPERFAAAIQLDKMWWPNVNDTAGIDSPIKETYGIDEIPAFLLLDENHRLKARFLSVQALELWLAENQELLK